MICRNLAPRSLKAIPQRAQRGKRHKLSIKGRQIGQTLEYTGIDRSNWVVPNIKMLQISQVLELVGGDDTAVDKSIYRYPGPRPQSVETALVMLADGCEAYVRSQNPETDAELRSMIKDMVDRRVGAGQLNNTELTMKDLKVIIDSYTATLRGSYHTRVDYPEDDETKESNPETESSDVTVVEMRE